jgi:hypothetical protein
MTSNPLVQVVYGACQLNCSATVLCALVVSPRRNIVYKIEEERNPPKGLFLDYDYELGARRPHGDLAETRFLMCPGNEG